MGGAEHAAWNLLLDMAGHDLPRWVLIGGLMVQAHLHHAGATPRRTTTDLDVIVDVQVALANATERFAHALVDQLQLRPRGRPHVAVGQVVHQFIRDCDGAVVDLLAPDKFNGPHRTIHRPHPRSPGGDGTCFHMPRKRSSATTAGPRTCSSPTCCRRSSASGGHTTRSLTSTTRTGTLRDAADLGLTARQARSNVWVNLLMGSVHRMG